MQRSPSIDMTHPPYLLLKTTQLTGGHDPRWEDDEIRQGGAILVPTLRREYRIYGWIGMIVRDGVECTEIPEVVLVREVIPVPRHHVVGRVGTRSDEEGLSELARDDARSA